MVFPFFQPTASLLCAALLPAAGELEERLAADQQAHRRVAQLLTVTFSQQLPWAPGGQQGAAGSKPQGKCAAGQQRRRSGQRWMLCCAGLLANLPAM